jgi:MFS family permease
LFAAALGTGFSISLTMFIGSLFVPAMTAEFGWSRSEVSLVGSVGLLGVLAFPMAGRLADVFGSRAVVLAGVFAIPALHILYSLQTGPLWQFLTIQTLWTALAALWSATVLGRVAAGRLTLARGLGIAILLSAPALTGAIAAPMLTSLVESHGWRSAYRVLAVVEFAAGLLAVALLPAQGERGSARVDTRPTIEALREIAGSRAMQVLGLAMFLCNLGVIATGLQFAPILIERGIQPADVGRFLSAYAVGVIMGRFIIGISLDRFPTRFVAAFGMGLPAVGFALLAVDAAAPFTILCAVALLGLSQGAEGDIGGYVGARYVGPQLFGTIFGSVTAVTSLAGFVGSLIASAMLRNDTNSADFLIFLSVTTALGALTFLLLPHRVPPVVSQANTPVFTNSEQEPV